MAERVTPSRSQNAGGAAQDNRLQQAVESIAELEVQLTAQLEQQLALRREIEDIIAGVQEDRLRTLLQLRHVDGLPWEVVSATLRLEKRWVFRLYSRALSELTIESHYNPVI